MAQLLDSPSGVGDQESRDTVAQQLEQLNLLLAERNCRSRRILRIVAGVLIGAAVLTALLLVLSLAAFRSLTAEPHIIEGNIIIVDPADNNTSEQETDT